jgi:hypothetical protein
VNAALAMLAVLLCGPSVTDAGTAAGNPSVEGQWSGVHSWPIIAIHTHVLPTGNLLMWPRGVDHVHDTDARIWDPAAEEFIANVPVHGTNVFCAGHSFLPDGRLLVTGGHVVPGTGVSSTNIFNPFTNTWARARRMNGWRWYPTNVTLASGEVLVAGGLITYRRGSNRVPQVWTTRGRWRSLSRAKLDYGEYPYVHLAPNGRVLWAGPDQETIYVSTTSRGAWSFVARASHPWRSQGTSTLYADGRVINIGGGDPPVATAEMLDLTQSAPRWRSVAPMAFPRRQHNTTILPDGTLFVSGGTAGPGYNNEAAAVLATELWDPRTERFTRMASIAVPRIYHSTAILLPDARVLTAGGEGEGGTPRPNAQIYSPPYLFRGARPRVTGAPAAVTYGQTFTVSTPDAAGIRGVTWLRLGSVTHGLNMDQRINRLGFTAAADLVNVRAPGSRNYCPPGHYMLFILNASGVPSVARIIQIR